MNHLMKGYALTRSFLMSNQTWAPHCQLCYIRICVLMQHVMMKLWCIFAFVVGIGKSNGSSPGKQEWTVLSDHDLCN